MSGAASFAQPPRPTSGDSAALRARISKLPASKVDLNKAATAPSVHTAPAPTVGQASSVRYVPLPPEEAREVRKVLTDQLVLKKPLPLIFPLL